MIEVITIKGIILILAVVGILAVAAHKGGYM